MKVLSPILGLLGKALPGQVNAANRETDSLIEVKPEINLTSELPTPFMTFLDGSGFPYPAVAEFPRQSFVAGDYQTFNTSDSHTIAVLNEGVWRLHIWAQVMPLGAVNDLTSNWHIGFGPTNNPLFRFVNTNAFFQSYNKELTFTVHREKPIMLSRVRNAGAGTGTNQYHWMIHAIRLL